MIEEGRHARPKPGTTGAAFRRAHPSHRCGRIYTCAGSYWDGRSSDWSKASYQSQSFLPARDLGELETEFRAVVQDRCDVLVVFPDSAMYEVSDRIARFALEAK